MEGGDSEFANFTLPTLKAFLEARSQNVSGNKQCLVARAIGCPKTHFFHELAIFWSTKKKKKKKDAKTLFSFLFFPTLHPLSPVMFLTVTVVAFVLLRNSSFNFHCYTQCEATPTHKSGDLSRFLARKITKGIHSCKPASLNSPIERQTDRQTGRQTDQAVRRHKRRAPRPRREERLLQL